MRNNIICLNAVTLHILLYDVTLNNYSIQCNPAEDGFHFESASPQDFFLVSRKGGFPCRCHIRLARYVQIAINVPVKLHFDNAYIKEIELK